MIRRSVPLVEKPDKLLLVSQVEHARVSAELARAWGSEQVPPVVCAADSDNPHLQDVRHELLSAIARHDDGWARWEANPAIDPEQGRPYSFLDLPREQALPLWRDSVLRCRQIGPLAGWVVAGHFSHLLADSHEAGCVVSQEWQQEIELWRDDWFRDWHSTNRPVHSAKLAEECLEWLRVFDWRSPLLSGVRFFAFRECCAASYDCMDWLTRSRLAAFFLSHCAGGSVRIAAEWQRL
ncbi:DUF3891 family protein [Aeoliella mucimassa]|uniref:Uncharacterized protein n=1 Tax=Aeoliella mucimassa TaxID=2527972 RepID=A0A518AU17_9BACT|nr:DUF3891 family protein [Aeoliella mucimassa]QDU58219.1 hypothetical protein Pan181_44520 [Aeoliella mucimassa]